MVTVAALSAAVTWAYWPTLRGMAGRWWNEPQYSHGYVVPLFALALLWMRRDRIQNAELRPSLWGLIPLALGAGLRLVGAFYYMTFLDDLSLLPTLFGLAWLLGGATALRWAGPSIAFLAFMLPLSHSLTLAVSHPLQRIGTVVSTYTLQTIGLPALAEGNMILLDEHKINVAEACSGLGMLMVFFALATGFVMVVRRPLLDTIILLVSAVPIAIAANVARITVTAILFRVADSKWAERFFHDFAGLVLMMPMALLLLWLELWLLGRLLVEPAPEQLMTVGLPGAGKFLPHPVPQGSVPGR
jgi:exosortase